ncbi:MAG: IPExxxVDY family protein [Flavobacteriales bacterium]|nr:IPExxxVDY family protein [Flavobacteriales bacterium]
MKTLRFNKDFELDFLILGINSHIKLYKLCWEINKKLHTSFVKNKNHIINNNQEFERFSYTNKNSEITYNIISNVSNTGYLDSNNKSVNYFMIVQGEIYNTQKTIERLNQIEDILLVFELNLSKIKTITPFIIND